MRPRHACQGLLLLLCLTPCIGSLALANTITVRQDGNGDFLTITNAVAAAAANDTIEVGPGTYYESIDLYIPLTLVSTDGPGSTIMDGSGTNHHLWFFDAPGSEVIGIGFLHGYAVSGGGSIRTEGGATLTVRDCEFIENVSNYDGGAVFARDAASELVIEDCVFDGNIAVRNAGAGIAILGSQLTFTRCRFVDNSSGLFSGAVTSDHSHMDVVGCLFANNHSGDVAGGIYYYYSDGLLQNNTFYGNTSPGGTAGTVVLHNSQLTTFTQNIVAEETARYGLYYLGGEGSHSCNVFWSNAAGASNVPLAPTEVAADPIFCGATVGNFDIAFESPAAPANNPCGLLAGAFPASCAGPVLGPIITSILDVGNDEGRQVRIVWDRSLYDAPGDGIDITGYAVYRRQDAYVTADPPAPQLAQRQENLLGGWDYLVTVPARGDESYQYVAATLCDSTKLGGVCWSVFLVSALTPDPLAFYDSDPDSGYSVDNIKPVSPHGLSVAYNNGNGNQLTWEPSEAPDLASFQIYRGPTPDFTIGAENLVHTTGATEWVDSDGGSGVHYKVTAMDDAGNESEPSAPVSITGLGDSGIPRDFALRQNVPNPFNPSTVIEFDVPPSGGHVTLRVYDVSGRLVRTLVDAVQAGGTRQATWDGRDDRGRRVSSGVYFYRLQAPAYKKTLKMSLVE